MLRGTVSLPLRLIRDAAPSSRHIPSTLPAAVGLQWQRPFSTTEPLEKKRGPIIKQVQKLKKKKRYPNPQAKRVAELRQRKNVERQTVLREERIEAYGDPIWGVKESTDFVKSFDNGIDPEHASAGSQRKTSSPILNAFFRADELQEDISVSRALTTPVADERPGAGDPVKEQKQQERHENEHETAAEAINRILGVDHASSKQRKHINIQRCIEKFGRHHTDSELGVVVGDEIQNAAALDQTRGDEISREKPRIGPDTGSSEVQIAILTMKIRKLAQEREGPLRKDKVNKRNLRLLLHRRQKLLKYFYKKNRGGPRWQHLVDTLGLTDATWKDEIVLL